MRIKKIILLGVCTVSMLVSGCAVVTVASTAVVVAGTAVSVGVTAGSMAVGAATTVAKGAVSAGSALMGDEESEE